MKSKTMKIWALFLTLVTFAALPSIAHAAGKPSLQLSVKPSEAAVGQQLTVEILVRNAPPIYGADVRLSFDPNALEVVDVDLNTAGVQFQAGSFIDPAKSYPLQYQVDNGAGKIVYALTLLNPAPEAKGNGSLATITFQAKAVGKATVTISEGMFGTRTGETISPDLVSAQVTITAQAVATSGTTTSRPAPGNTWPIVGLGIVALAGLGSGVGFFWRKQRLSAWSIQYLSRRKG